MQTNKSLTRAKQAKNDEFYTLYADVEAEVEAQLARNPGLFQDRTVLLPCDDPDRSNFTRYFLDNFTRFGLKKLVSTSIAPHPVKQQPTLFDPPVENTTDTHGKLLIATKGKPPVRTLLDGGGDFRSMEITRFRDKADIVITNPPFSLFREFVEWVTDGGKRFLILGTLNAISYKETFPLLADGAMWFGQRPVGKTMLFDIPDGDRDRLSANSREGSGYKTVNGTIMGRVASACWFTNLGQPSHGRLELRTMGDNLRDNTRLRSLLERKYGRIEYPRYENCDAIEVPYVDAIPSDYTGVMGVPVTFMQKWDSNRFDIVGFRKGDDGQDLTLIGKDAQRIIPYSRILIRRSKTGNRVLNHARQAKDDEYYTLYADVEAEMYAYLARNPNLFQDRTVLLPCDDPDRSSFTRYFLDNFDRLGLRRLISTSYNPNGRGRMLDADRHAVNTGLLCDDGDFRSMEITDIRDDADFIITNPPFSLFRRFIDWVAESGKRFAAIGNLNNATSRNILPMFISQTMWLGATMRGHGAEFTRPAVDGETARHDRINTVRWYTNIPYDMRPIPLQLDTMEHNLHHNTRLRRLLERKYGRVEYPHYDNFDAIEVPFVDAIPSDYTGVMGVPITFLDHHDPARFDIVGSSQSYDDTCRTKRYDSALRADAHILNASPAVDVNGRLETVYRRVLIRFHHA